MSVLEIMKKRYSVRKYERRQVEQEKIELILEAAWVAPTAANLQPHQIVVVNSEEGMEKLRKSTTSHHGAPMAFLILGDHSNSWKRPFDGKDMVDIDTSIAATQMMLEAEELGLGTCWVTYFDPDIIRKEFQLPDHQEPVSILLVGYGADKVQPSDRHILTRKKLSEIVFYNKYGNE